MLTASVKFNIAFIFRLYSGSMKVQELPQEKRIRWPLWGLSKWILSWRCVLLKLISITRQWWWYWFGIMLMTDDKHFDVSGGVGGGGCGELVQRWPRHGDTGKDSQLEKWYKCQLRHHQRQHKKKVSSFSRLFHEIFHDGTTSYAQHYELNRSRPVFNISRYFVTLNMMGANSATLHKWEYNCHQNRKLANCFAWKRFV